MRLSVLLLLLLFCIENDGVNFKKNYEIHIKVYAILYNFYIMISFEEIYNIIAIIARYIINTTVISRYI